MMIVVSYSHKMRTKASMVVTLGLFDHKIRKIIVSLFIFLCENP